MGEASTRRLFIALMLGELLGRSVASAVREALGVAERAEPPKHLRLYGARDLHATLVFLGSATEEQRAALEEALGAAVRGLDAPDLELASAGAFPDARRPRILWIGARERGATRIARVVEAVASAASSLGYQPDPRPWTPHITVARVRSARGRDRGRPPRIPDAFFALDLALPWQPGAVALVESARAGAGDAYRPLCTWPLPGPGA